MELRKFVLRKHSRVLLIQSIGSIVRYYRCTVNILSNSLSLLLTSFLTLNNTITNIAQNVTGWYVNQRQIMSTVHTPELRGFN